ncbi:MAG: glycosyltransferase [Bacteroidetes bacterium]|nr:glycosyltransferase [Bacteroidota bacterium]
MQLSIIIVNYNVKFFIEQCLFSVYKSLKNINAEIFVVDNNSVDGSIGLIKEKFPNVILIENHTNVGFAKANNQAIKLAKGKYILLLNPDTVLQEDTLQKSIDFMSNHPDAGGLGIKMVDGKGNFLPESKRGLPTPSIAFYKIFGLARLFPKSKKFGQYHLTFLDKSKNHCVDVLSGAYMLLRKETLDKVGLLDETYFMYGEDIDLSYRIIKGGYKNYYLAESSIIHYKGESTKKSSVNYVIVFYKAMAIFANTHFSKNNAGLFNLLIYFAIYLRAFTAVLTRLIRQTFFPAIDFIIILTGLYVCKVFYETEFKLYPNFYSKSILNIFFPIYTFIWMIFMYWSGGYDTPFKIKNCIRGILTGTAFILLIYSLLPEYYRFSRALILIGSIYTLLFYLISRILYSKLKIKRFQFKAKNINMRVAIVGSQQEIIRVNNLLNQTNNRPGFIGFVDSSSGIDNKENYLGHIDQINEIINIHKINEIIFCARDISSQHIIEQMVTMVSKDVEFKIAPPESLSIIGSNSIESAGDLYVIDTNNIGRPENIRKKRLLDFIISIALIIFSPFIIWFQYKKINFIKNCFYVLFGNYTWVGFGKELRRDLPTIKPSVLLPLNNNDNINNNKLFFTYAKEYNAENDLKTILYNFKKLGA